MNKHHHHLQLTGFGYLFRHNQTMHGSTQLYNVPLPRDYERSIHLLQFHVFTVTGFTFYSRYIQF